MTCDRCFAETNEDNKHWEHIFAHDIKYMLCEECHKDFILFLSPSLADNNDKIVKRRYQNISK